jgi:hypothetical protein
MRPRTAIIIAGTCVDLAIPVLAQIPDPLFRSGLTATVLSDRTAKARSGCTTISLTWRPRPGAAGYQGYVAAAREGDWRALPSRTPCNAAHADGKTGMVDEETAELTTRRRLFYRVVALGIKGPIDTTDIVPVELPPRTQAGPKF